MAIKIHTTKTTLRGLPAYFIDKISALQSYQLPEQYCYGKPMVKLITLTTPHYLLIYSVRSNGETYTSSLDEGKVYSKEQFQEMLYHIHQAGKRLERINRRLKAATSDWHGQKVFKI